jgi:aminopeptidase N
VTIEHIMSDSTVERAPIRLSDYREPAYLIDRLELVFDLDFAETRVNAELHFRRNPALTNAEPLCLHGEDLELLQIRIDGTELTPDRYQQSASELRIDSVPEQGVLHTVVRIRPNQNTRLEGLYQSGAFLTTQCEAEGFRRITFMADRPDVMARYTVTLRADRQRFPVLLCNGNPNEQGELDGGRHYARWVDPWPKPSYLFALVAGRLAHVEDHYRTMEGRDVTLRIYAEDSAIGRCQHAMDSLKRSMRWDEEKFGRAYDLDVFNIVATFDFNMGAMENKGLNIFNAKGIVADPDTATDADLAYVEAVVAHEYFHNWTGNRITCRDWFQLSLKEGLTVYRDQEFSADMGSRAVKRIDDVRALRAFQFPEDSGPFAHPVRPDQYVEINNFYTATVYEKGAQVVRLYRTLLGEEGFRRGMDLYFERHDGQAVTVDDFRRAMGDANGRDLDFLLPWYTQAGTPQLYAEAHYDAQNARYVLNLRQHTPATPRQTEKRPVPIPLRLALYAPDGQPLPLRLTGETASAGEQRVLMIDRTEVALQFEDVKSAPVASLLQDFSAPVQLHFAQDAAALAFRVAHDRDPFNRWEASQQIAERLLLARYGGADYSSLSDLRVFGDACARLLTDTALDPALIAECLEMPDEAYLGDRIEALNPVRLNEARHELIVWLGSYLRSALLARRDELAALADGGFNAAACAARRLRGRALHLLMAADPVAMAIQAERQYATANTMTQRMTALVAMMHNACPGAQQLAEQFYQRHADNPLLVDKWLGLQASNPQPGTLERVQALTEHEAFSWRNPNKVRALIGTFARVNRARFHEDGGAGYRLLGTAVARLDALNPQIAARTVSVFNSWRRLEPTRQAQMRTELERLKSLPELSPDTSEIITRALA